MRMIEGKEQKSAKKGVQKRALHWICFYKTALGKFLNHWCHASVKDKNGDTIDGDAVKKYSSSYKKYNKFI